MTTTDELRERFPVWKFAVGGSGELFRVPQNKQALCEPMVGPEFIRMDDAITALTERDARIERLRAWYEDRFAMLQLIQKNMRDPERKAVCDVLANGKTYETLGEEPTCDDLRDRAERAEADAERLAEAGEQLLHLCPVRKDIAHSEFWWRKKMRAALAAHRQERV